jgi:peptidoglycan/LPS O-acetylase OafA/YrhL
LRLNNFDLTRLLLAALVVFEHAYLVGLQPLRTSFLGVPIDAHIAVQGFFVVSGYLIFQSWERSSDWRDYMVKRGRRIYPAYFTVVVATAVIGVFFTSRGVISYFMSVEWIRYLVSNLVFLNFLQPTLPGVFADRVDPLINGPLWTIKIEVMFYLSVPFIAMLGRRYRVIWVMAALYVASFLWAQGFYHLYVGEGRSAYLKLSYQLPGQLSYFLGGGILFYYFEIFKRRAHLFGAAAALVILAHFNFESVALDLLYPAALSVVVIYFAEFVPYLGNFGRFGDLSYGLYILHFPVLQMVVASGLIANPKLAYAVGCLAAVVLAYLSWHLIEKPALLGSSHYRRAERIKRRSLHAPSAKHHGTESLGS